MSAESGVATFRDAQTGLWETFDPEQLASPAAWLRQPDVVWAWYLWRHHLVRSVEPNPGHYALADWQDRADVRVVTQNIDNLHERAGSQHVAHLHGSLFDFRCSRCGERYHGELPDMPEPVGAADPPLCACGGHIRPGVVWFGEALPDEPWQQALDAVAQAPTWWWWWARPESSTPQRDCRPRRWRRAYRVVEVNPDDTPLSRSATVTVRDTAANALPRLLDRLHELLG